MHQTNNISSIQLFSEFFHENQEKFLSFAYSYIRDRQEAEDILMESMITPWENRDKWEEDSNLHGLLLTIIKNKALNYLAHLQVRLLRRGYGHDRLQHDARRVRHRRRVPEHPVPRRPGRPGQQGHRAADGGGDRAAAQERRQPQGRHRGHQALIRIKKAHSRRPHSRRECL